MPKITTITCDVCGKPAKQVSPFEDLYLCELHYALEELKYLKEELEEKVKLFNATWKAVLEDQIRQLELIINANSN